MKTTANATFTTATRVPRDSGYSLLELLIVVAVLSSVAAGGYLLVTNVTVAARQTRLQSEVATVNGAVRSYLTHGGSIPADADGQRVINLLKTTADSNSSQRLAGLRGTMIDPRLRGELVTTAGGDRAVWNPAKQRFELKDTGAGFRAFNLGGDPTAPAVQEKRTGTMSLATRSNWVWDFDDGRKKPSPTPQTVLIASVPDSLPPAPATITKLAAPDFSLPGAIYDYSAFSPTMSLSLIDRNVPGTARIFYSIDNGPWLEYKDKALKIPPQLTTPVRAYAAAVDNENFEDSEQRTQQYETIYFTGATLGNFHTPAGDSRMKTNLATGQKSPTFFWGDPATVDNKQNQLDFTGASFANVAPDEEFVVGALTYYNGTTYAGTNATSVQIAIDLNLTTPAVKESLNFTFKLLSTSNLGKNADVDADYVYIPDVSTNFRTVIKGQTFALVLRFGEHSANGFTTIDTFHAHEGKTLRGTIYGRLTAAGAQP